MRISIERVTQLPSGGTLVTFISQLGAASGRWVGSLPEEGSEYDVELEIPGLLQWGTDICETEKHEPEISQCAEATSIVGRLQSVDREGLAEVRLHEAIVVVDIGGGGYKPPCDVLIKTSNLQLFDANI